MEMLAPKQNGNAVEVDAGNLNKTQKSSIRSMWKKAFKTLKREGRAKGDKSDRAMEKDAREKEKEREREAERDDRSEKSLEKDDKRYSRMVGGAKVPEWPVSPY